MTLVECVSHQVALKAYQDALELSPRDVELRERYPPPSHRAFEPPPHCPRRSEHVLQHRRHTSVDMLHLAVRAKHDADAKEEAVFLENISCICFNANNVG
jgi:hypothetical protein